MKCVDRRQADKVEVCFGASKTDNEENNWSSNGDDPSVRNEKGEVGGMWVHYRFY